GREHRDARWNGRPGSHPLPVPVADMVFDHLHAFFPWLVLQVATQVVLVAVLVDRVRSPERQGDASEGNGQDRKRRVKDAFGYSDHDVASSGAHRSPVTRRSVGISPIRSTANANSSR